MDQKIKFTIYRDIIIRKYLTKSGVSYWKYTKNGHDNTTRTLAEAKFGIQFT